MDPTSPPVLSVILRSTLHLVRYYGNTAENGLELNELTVAPQRAIAALEVKGANVRRLPAREAPSATRMDKTA